MSLKNNGKGSQYLNLIRSIGQSHTGKQIFSLWFLHLQGQFSTIVLGDLEKLIEGIIFAIEGVSCAEDQVGLATFSVLNQVALRGQKGDTFWVGSLKVGGFEVAFTGQADAHRVLRGEIAAVVDSYCPFSHLSWVGVEMRSQQGILRLQCTYIRNAYFRLFLQVDHVVLFEVMESKVQTFLNFVVFVIFWRSGQQCLPPICLLLRLRFRQCLVEALIVNKICQIKSVFCYFKLFYLVLEICFLVLQSLFREAQ